MLHCIDVYAFSTCNPLRNLGLPSPLKESLTRLEQPRDRGYDPPMPNMYANLAVEHPVKRLACIMR